MINYFNAIIFGLVQGATEFLPVSSSGHLVVLHKLFPNLISDELAFDVLLHLATLLALLWFFRQEVIDLIVAWCRSIAGKHDETSRLAWLIIIGIIPAAVIGYFFGDTIETVFHSTAWVAIMLVLVGILFIVFEKLFGKNINSLNQLNWQKALAIGCAQVLSFIPGTSRSGITIIAGLGIGLKRESAVKFSFLMSMPLIAAAAASQISSLWQTNFSTNDIAIYVIAFVAAVISGYLAIKYFLKFSANNSLNVFAYYRFILALLIVLFFWN